MRKIILDPDALLVERFEPDPGGSVSPAWVSERPTCETYSERPGEYTCWYEPSCVRGLCDY